MTKKEALNRIKKLEAFKLANKFAIKNGQEPLKWDGEIKTEFKCQKKGDTTYLNIMGPMIYFDNGEEIVEKIQNISTPKIRLNLNSEGGDLMAARAIASALNDNDAELTTINTGMAASAASILFAQGEKRLAAEGSLTMIHNVMSGFLVFGNKETMAEARKDIDNEIELLTKLDKDLAKTYARISNMDEKEITNAMNKETFYTQEEVVENGLATGKQAVKKTKTNKSNTIDEVSKEAVSILKNIFQK